MPLPEDTAAILATVGTLLALLQNISDQLDILVFQSTEGTWPNPPT